MQVLLKAVALTAALFAYSQAQAQEKDDDGNAIDDRPHMTMIGEARRDVVPDLAEITLGVATERPTASEASLENARIAQEIIAAAKADGVAAKDLRTTAATLTQVFDDIRDAQGHVTGRKPRGFSARNVVTVKSRDLAKVGALAQTLIGKGATELDGISFLVEHPEPVLDQLLAEAVSDAKRKARIAADAMGVKLGPVLLIERPSAEPGPAPLFRTRVMATAAAVPVEGGTETLSSEIEITWAIGP